MLESTNKTAFQYKINPTLAKGIKGVITSVQQPINTIIAVENTKYLVVKSRLIEVSYDYLGYNLIISDGINILVGSKDCTTFVRQNGFNSTFDFITTVFNGVPLNEYHKGVKCYFNQFSHYDDLIHKK